MKKTLLTVALCSLMILGITGCGNDKVKEAEKDLQETQEKYGWVEKETIEIILAKFNTEIMNEGLNTPASNDYMTTENSLYWFALTDNISLYLKPEKFSENKENDILNMSALYLEKNNYNEETALKYVKLLIKANNKNITDTEIDNLIKEAKEKSSSKKTANNGKGISVGMIETEDAYEYQVIRLYK